MLKKYFSVHGVNVQTMKISSDDYLMTRLLLWGSVQICVKMMIPPSSPFREGEEDYDYELAR